MSQGPETLLVGTIRVALLKRHPDAWVFKVHGSPYQESGVPDLVAVIQGRFFGFEVKKRRPGESEAHARDRATPRQRQQITRINAAGGTAAVILSAREALTLVDATLRSTQSPYEKEHE